MFLGLRGEYLGGGAVYSTIGIESLMCVETIVCMGTGAILTLEKDSWRRNRKQVPLWCPTEKGKNIRQVGELTGRAQVWIMQENHERNKGWNLAMRKERKRRLPWWACFFKIFYLHDFQMRTARLRGCLTADLRMDSGQVCSQVCAENPPPPQYHHFP